MTGNQLKFEIKKLGITQEEAAKKLGITRQTLGVWFKYAQIDDTTRQLASAKLNIDMTAITDTASVVSFSNSTNMVSIPHDVWAVIKDQAASLKAKDEQIGELIKGKDEQMNRALNIIEEQVKKSVGDAESVAKVVAQN